MVATLGALVATTAKQDGDVLLPRSPRSLHLALKNFVDKLYVTLVQVGVTWWHRNVISKCDDSPTSLSQALAAYESTPWTTWDQVTRVVRAWRELLAKIVASWARLAREATELRDTCREVAAAEATTAATATAQAGDLQEKATHWRRAHRHLVTAAQQLPLALEREVEASAAAAHEARLMAAGNEIVVATMALTEAVVASSRAKVATKRGQRAEEALGLLERLVAACDEATAFPRELQRLLWDIEAALKVSPALLQPQVTVVATLGEMLAILPNLDEEMLVVSPGCLYWDLALTDSKTNSGATWADVTAVASAWQDWVDTLMESRARPVEEATELHDDGEDAATRMGPPAEEALWLLGDLLAAWDRATVFPLELQCWLWDIKATLEGTKQLFPSLLESLVTVVAALSKVAATTAMLESDMLRLWPCPERCPGGALGSLHANLAGFSIRLRHTLDLVGVTRWHRDVTFRRDKTLTSLGQALAAYESTPWTTWAQVTKVARAWQKSVATVVDSWFQLLEEATELRDACRDAVTGEGIAAAIADAMGEAKVATSQAEVATMVRERAEAALGLLEQLVAACDKATAFPRELQHRVRDIKAALKGTNEPTHDFRVTWAAKVAEAERLWDASARLATRHLLETLQDMECLYWAFYYQPAPGDARVVPEICQKAIEDIPRLLWEQ
ncbi:unnamed protein product [Coccothraustes coccothraustes]